MLRLESPLTFGESLVFLVVLYPEIDLGFGGFGFGFSGMHEPLNNMSLRAETQRRDTIPP